MTTLLLLLFLHGVFLALVLLFVGARHDPANRWLAALTLAASLLLLNACLGAAGFYQNRPQLAGILFPAWFLVAPLAFRYVQAFLRVAKPVHGIWVVLPALLAIAWLTITSLLPTQDEPTVKGALARTVISYSMFWLLTGWCAIHSWRAIRATHYEQRVQAPWHTAWLGALMAGLVFYTVFDMVLALSLLLTGGYPQWAGWLSVLVLSMLLYGIAVLMMLPEGLLARAPWPGPSYRKAGLTESVARDLTVGLEQLMRTKQPWLEDGLDQQRLASLAGITPHQLSQLLSQHLGASFADYVNGYRVAEAKRLLFDAGTSRTVLDIGLESGFASNATFYRAFRKHTGMTPREYLSQAAVSNIESLDKSRKKSFS